MNTVTLLKSAFQLGLSYWELFYWVSSFSEFLVFKKDTKLLAAYFVLLFLFIICEFGVGGGSYTLRSEIPQTLDDAWATLDPTDRSNLQSYWQCCGWTNPYDNPGPNCATYNQTNPNAPASTTGAVTPNVTERFFARQTDAPSAPNTTNSSVPLVYPKGCQDGITEFFQAQLYAVGTAGIVFATLQLVALISSVVVFAFIKVEQRRSQDEKF